MQKAAASLSGRHGLCVLELVVLGQNTFAPAAAASLLETARRSDTPMRSAVGHCFCARGWYINNSVTTDDTKSFLVKAPDQTKLKNCAHVTEVRLDL